MAKLLKITAILLICVFLLLIFAITIIAASVDANDFKPQIQTLIEKKLGRQLRIKGDIELSIFPWIGFSTTKLSLSNVEGFSDKPFAEVEKASIKVKLLPLISNNIEVKQIRLTGLVLNLTKNKQGLNNWDDLFNTTKTDSGPDFLIDSLAIDGISVEQAKIAWDDQQQNRHTEINDFNFHTGKIVFNHPISIDSSLTLVNKEPAIQQFFQFSSSLTINKTFDTFQLTNISLDSVTHSKDLAVTPLKLSVLANAALDLSQQTLDISTLEIKLKNLLISAKIKVTDIMKQPLLKGAIKIPAFNLAQLLKSLSIALPEMKNPTALSKLSTTFDIQANTESADIRNITIKLDDSTISGSACIKDYTLPASQFKLTVDTVDIDSYLPMEKQAVAKPHTTEPQEQTDKDLAASTALFPLDRLKKLNTTGLLTIDKLTSNGLSMHHLSLKLNTKDKVFKHNENNTACIDS